MELEIKVMWCKGLTAFNFFQKLSIYAAVSISCEDDRIQLTSDQKQEQKTPVDEDNEGSPQWNYPMKFYLKSLVSISPEFNNLSLLFELRIGQLFGDRVIGEVRVPIKDLIQSVGGEIVRFVCYEVRNPEGKHNGILDFSYKVISSSSKDLYQQSQHNDQIHQEYQNYNVDVSGYDHQIESGRIQYPKIEFEDDHHHQNNNSMVSVSTPHIVYPPISSASLTTTSSAAEYQLSAPDIYPPPRPALPPSQMWAPPPQPHYPPPSHYVHPPPPPPPRPYVYPPPPQSQPYGDPHWGYQRPPGYHYNW